MEQYAFDAFSDVQGCRKHFNILLVHLDIFFILGHTGNAQESLLTLQSGCALETVWDVQDGTCADHVQGK